MSSFRSTRPSAAFLQLIEELTTADTTATPWTTVGQKRKASERKKSVRGAALFTDRDREGGVSGEEEGEEAELFQDKKRDKQEARRLKKEMRKKEVMFGSLLYWWTPLGHHQVS